MFIVRSHGIDTRSKTPQPWSVLEDDLRIVRGLPAVAYVQLRS